MIAYKISYTKPHRHYIDFEVTFPHNGNDELLIQLPAWRPGRYELGNFAKNIRSWNAFDVKGNRLPFTKKTKDSWLVFAKKQDKVIIKYSFFAIELNAGSTYLDENQLYINPVNCFLYLPDFPELPFELSFDLPSNYQIATGMKSIDNHKLCASNMQEVMDCPLIASATLQHDEYDLVGVKYHIWIQGEHTIDNQVFLKDHIDFTKAQLSAFGDIPCDEYHFLYHFPPYRARHGVEHSNSTVIALGPGNMLHFPHIYNELIGISCHELYHTWNIKSFRPSEMMPYDFTKENYTDMGYVAEGVTTYFGDQFLYRSGTFSEAEYLKRLAKEIEKHMHNYGRFNYSVAQSSFDTWLDGYEAGIPWRKVSIYTEGLLITFICDVRILENTQGEKSLDDVMKLMYERFGKTKTGYTRKDYQNLLEEVGGISFSDIFTDLVYGTKDYLPFLKKAFSSLGLVFAIENNPKQYVSDFGFIANDKQEITMIAPDSPADKAGLWMGDKIVSVNNQRVQYSLNQAMPSSIGKELLIHYYRHNELRSVLLKADENRYFPIPRVRNEGKTGLLFEKWERKL